MNFFEETYMTLRIELFSQNLRIDFFYQYDSLQEFEPFEPFHMTRRIEHFLEYDSQNWTSFSENDSKNCNLFLQKVSPRIDLFFECDSKNWIFFNMTLRKVLFCLLWLKAIEPLFQYPTHRIEHLLIDRLIWRTELNIFSLMSHRIEHFWTRKNWTFFFSWRKELNHFFFFGDSIEHFSDPKKLNILFEHDSQNWTLFWNVTQRIEPDFQKNDSKNWSLFTKWLKELNLFFLKVWRSTIETFEEIWLKGLNFLSMI